MFVLQLPGLPTPHTHRNNPAIPSQSCYWTDLERCDGLRCISGPSAVLALAGRGWDWPCAYAVCHAACGGPVLAVAVSGGNLERLVSKWQLAHDHTLADVSDRQRR